MTPKRKKRRVKKSARPKRKPQSTILLLRLFTPRAWQVKSVTDKAVEQREFRVGDRVVVTVDQDHMGNIVHVFARSCSAVLKGELLHGIPFSMCSRITGK